MSTDISQISNFIYALMNPGPNFQELDQQLTSFIHQPQSFPILSTFIFNCHDVKARKYALVLSYRSYKLTEELIPLEIQDNLLQQYKSFLLNEPDQACRDHICNIILRISPLPEDSTPEIRAQFQQSLNEYIFSLFPNQDFALSVLLFFKEVDLTSFNREQAIFSIQYLNSLISLIKSNPPKVDTLLSRWFQTLSSFLLIQDKIIDPNELFTGCPDILTFSKEIYNSFITSSDSCNSKLNVLQEVINFLSAASCYLSEIPDYFIPLIQFTLTTIQNTAINSDIRMMCTNLIISSIKTYYDTIKNLIQDIFQVLISFTIECIFTSEDISYTDQILSPFNESMFNDSYEDEEKLFEQYFSLYQSLLADSETNIVSGIVVLYLIGEIINYLPDYVIDILEDAVQIACKAITSSNFNYQIAGSRMIQKLTSIQAELEPYIDMITQALISNIEASNDQAFIEKSRALEMICSYIETEPSNIEEIISKAIYCLNGPPHIQDASLSLIATVLEFVTEVNESYMEQLFPIITTFLDNSTNHYNPEPAISCLKSLLHISPRFASTNLGSLLNNIISLFNERDYVLNTTIVEFIQQVCQLLPNTLKPLVSPTISSLLTIYKVQFSLQPDSEGNYEEDDNEEEEDDDDDGKNNRGKYLFNNYHKMKTTIVETFCFLVQAYPSELHPHFEEILKMIDEEFPFFTNYEGFISLACGFSSISCDVAPIFDKLLSTIPNCDIIDDLSATLTAMNQILINVPALINSRNNDMFLCISNIINLNHPKLKIEKKNSMIEPIRKPIFQLLSTFVNLSGQSFLEKFPQINDRLCSFIEPKASPLRSYSICALIQIYALQPSSFEDKLRQLISITLGDLNSKSAIIKGLSFESLSYAAHISTGLLEQQKDQLFDLCCKIILGDGGKSLQLSAISLWLSLTVMYNVSPTKEIVNQLMNFINDNPVQLKYFSEFALWFMNTGDPMAKEIAVKIAVISLASNDAIFQSFSEPIKQLFNQLGREAFSAQPDQIEESLSYNQSMLNSFLKHIQ